MLEPQLLDELPKESVMREAVTQKPAVYTIEEVYEILRQVMFTGTPELYDQGGMHHGMKAYNGAKIRQCFLTGASQKTHRQESLKWPAPIL